MGATAPLLKILSVSLHRETVSASAFSGEADGGRLDGGRLFGGLGWDARVASSDGALPLDVKSEDREKHVSLHFI